MKNFINLGLGAAKTPETLAQIVQRGRAYAHEIEVMPFFVGYIEATRTEIGDVKLIVTPIPDLSQVPEVGVLAVKGIVDRMYCMGDAVREWQCCGKV